MTTAASAPDSDELRAWLADGAAAKAIVRARVAGRRSWTWPASWPPTPASTPGDASYRSSSRCTRTEAIEDAIRAVLRAVDLEGLERQAVAATRARARARHRADGPHHIAGVRAPAARRKWPIRPDICCAGGTAPLSPAVESLRGHSAQRSDQRRSVRLRPAASLETNQPPRQGLERSMDRALASLERLQAPTSRWWSLLGLLQTLATVAIAVSAAWVVLWILARPSVDSVEFPIVGSVPIPFAALIASVLVGYLLARLLGLHAGWLGRRWADRVRDRVAAAVREEVTERGFAPIDRLEDARKRLATSTSAVIRDCGRGRRQQLASAKALTFWNAVWTSAGGLAAAPDWAAVVSHVPIVWTSPLTDSRRGLVDHSATTELSSLAVDWSMSGQSLAIVPAKSSQKPWRSPVPMLAGTDGIATDGAPVELVPLHALSANAVKATRPSRERR